MRHCVHAVRFADLVVQRIVLAVAARYDAQAPILPRRLGEAVLQRHLRRIELIAARVLPVPGASRAAVRVAAWK